MNAYLKWIVGIVGLAALAACSGGAPTTANPVDHGSFGRRL